MLKLILSFFIILACTNNSEASQLPEYPFIHTSGFAYAKVQPDFGEILFEINVIDTDPDVAFNNAAARITDIKTLLAQQNIAENDIVIRDLKRSVSKTDGSQSPSTSLVELSSNIYIKVRDLSHWQAIMLPILKLKNLDKFGTAFDISERGKIELDLAGEAIKDAQRKASSLVNIAGKRLGAVMAISESRIKSLGSSFGVVSENTYSQDGDTRLQTVGEDLLRVPPIKLQATIDVMFELKPKSIK
ncbi:SIMPL domain-containing protein [Undibacterium sp. 5I1]|uniref:SIMPL domain-containing protein n=1 Tax=unclassified Undibacterium TaxID=2630295 RepID=UPI002AB55D80|nr:MULTISPECIES: SIMPL domain-containing protein [unclassified Undibacterium]MDY7537812.1 SIMPL domain-containing protein [Undibacterium sp. 5I1]MEB0229929.1 SIMPL domain-containing protein [Undibacterium sp. 10I3]MEB0257606.1 SIMPL domain-containing protein [Undibacterium sp. 5I1]